MNSSIQSYVRFVDKVNKKVGRITMYMIFVIMAVLLYSSVSKTFFNPSIWTIEIAQFLMMAYFLLGGAYSMQMGDHVRMDLLYGSWSDTTKAWFDVFTILFLISYLVLLLYGGYSSTSYALQYNERSYSAWRPYMWPIKIIMCVGIFLMLMQAIATFFKDLAKIKGEPIQ